MAGQPLSKHTHGRRWSLWLCRCQTLFSTCFQWDTRIKTKPLSPRSMLIEQRHSLSLFDVTWKTLLAPLALSPPVQCVDPPVPRRCLPLRSRAQYVQSHPPWRNCIDWSHPLTFIVSGYRYPCVGGNWSKLSIGLLSHGLKGRTPADLWVVGMALTRDKDMAALGQIWAQVLQLCTTIFDQQPCS